MSTEHQSPPGSNPGHTGMNSPRAEPSPALFFDTINAYQKTAAIKAAVELGVFTALSAAPASAETVADRCQSSPRGMRILCDHLALLGFLTKTGERYALTRDSGLFLDRNSPAYIGGALEFLLSGEIRGAFDHLTEAARQGGTAQPRQGTLAPGHPVWVAFARGMGPLMGPAAAALAELVPLDQSRPVKILDISASHGFWGLAFAKRNPLARLVALDWEPVLKLTLEHVRAAGVEDRFSTIAGSAFEVDFGADYDVILAPNFLHHFNTADCVVLLKKARAALRPDGALAIVEFVPDSDRLTPPTAAAFSLVMLATTPEGDAYTFDELSEMLRQAGFNPPVRQALPASMNIALVARLPRAENIPTEAR